MLPTPTTQEFEHKDMELTHTNRRKTKDGKDSHSLNLADTVRLWPTPTASDPEGGVVKNVELNNGNFSRTNKKGVRWGVKLKDAVSHVEMLPTPTARDWKGGRKPETLKKAGRTENNSLPDKVNAQIKTTGSLNPDWVEWLMGYGQGYTDPDNKSSFTLGSHQGFPNEPEIARVTTENQYRKDRLKALGNSIVPQIAYHIGNAILEQEKNES
jgi:site-specific DNA-cytosine methylase